MSDHLTPPAPDALGAPAVPRFVWGVLAIWCFALGFWATDQWSAHV